MRRGRTNASTRLLVACQMVNALQSIASRNVDPLESAVVSVCALQGRRGLQRHPADRALLGTMRTLHRGGARSRARRASGRSSRRPARLYGAKAIGRLPPRLPGHRQPPGADRLHRQGRGRGRRRRARVDTTIAAADGRRRTSPTCSRARPGAYIFMGNGDTAGVHHPKYDFNDEAIPYGVSLWAKVIETAMPAR